MSQLAVPMACQTPFRLGLPSVILVPLPGPLATVLATALAGAAGAWALPGVSVSEIQTTAAATVDKRVSDLRIGIVSVEALVAPVGIQSYIRSDPVSIERLTGLRLVERWRR